MPRSTEKRRPGRPGPAPLIESARRLEYLREKILGIGSVSEFWKELDFDKAKDGDDYVSYEAAVTYHHNRPAPVKYLVRISETFQVSVDWLATGRSFDAGPEQQVDLWWTPEAIDVIAEAFPPIMYVERVANAIGMAFNEWAALESARRGVVVSPETCAEKEELARASAELAKKIADCIAFPFSVLDVSTAYSYTVGELESYATHMAEALIALIPKSYTGQRFQDLVEAGVSITAAQEAENTLARSHTKEARALQARSRAYVRATNFDYGGRKVWLTARQRETGDALDWYIMVDGESPERFREWHENDPEDPERVHRHALAWLEARFGPEDEARRAIEQREVNRMVQGIKNGPQQWEVTVETLKGPVTPLEFEHRGHIVRLEPRDGSLWVVADDEEIQLHGIRPSNLVDVITEGYRKATEWLNARIDAEDRSDADRKREIELRIELAEKAAKLDAPDPNE